MSRIVCLMALAVVAPVFADEPLPVENLFPLTVGNVWTYKVSGQEDRFVVRAVRQEMVGEQTCVLLEASLKDRVVATEHLAFTKTGLCRFRVDKEDLESPICILRDPAPKKGWRETFRLGNRSATATFWTSNGEVTVPLGKYKTTAVHANMSEGNRLSTTSIWYADGIGIVRQTIDEGKRQLVLELEKFERADPK